MSDYITRAEFDAFKKEVISALPAPPEAPDKDFPIRFGKQKGRKPSELTVKELDGLAWFKQKCVAEAPADKDPKYVEYDKRDAEHYKAWAAFKRAGGKVTAQHTTSVADYDSSGYGANEGAAEAEASQYDDAF